MNVDLSQLESLCDRGRSLSDLGDLIETSVEQKRQDTLLTFAYGQAPDGTAWKPLAASTLAQKKGRGIGRETDTMYNATDVRVSGNEGEVFNDTPYAGFFNAIRPFLAWSDSDRQRIQASADDIVERRLR